MADKKEGINYERLWCYTGLVILSVSIFGFLAGFKTDFYERNYDQIHYLVLPGLVLLEGLVLFTILVLYSAQHLKIKKINAEKAEAVRLLEKRLFAIEAAADGIGIINSDGNLIYMNSALKDLHGIQDDEIENYLNHPWIDLYSENGRKEVEEFVMPYLYEYGEWRGNSPILRKDSKIIETELSLRLLDDGTMIGTARDISDKKRASKEKKALEEQFYQAQKMEAIGRLAGGIAHDFNNILAAISGYAEFLEEDLPKTSKQKAFAENILKACSQAKELVDQMLAFSRHKQIRMENMNIVKPFQETALMIKASFPKSIEFEFSGQIDTLRIKGNASQISQIIMNLCVNARDAIDDDHGKISLSLNAIETKDVQNQALLKTKNYNENELAPFFEEISEVKTRLIFGALEPEKTYAKLNITDTGSGMSRTIMEHIFEPFFTTKSVDKGTGLGLATVHGVTIGHEGAVFIESELGVGTSFDLYFPLVEEETITEESKNTRLKSIKDAQILLVEDQSEVQDMMVNMLERMGHNVDSCSDGLEALQVMKDGLDYYDLVITDQSMPKMTGLEMLEQIYVLDDTIPFILMSGYSYEKLLEIMDQHPAVKAVLRKPVMREDLETEINKILSDRSLKAK